MASHGNHHYEGAILVFATGPFTFTSSFPPKDGVGHGLGQATLTNFMIPLLCLVEALSVLVLVSVRMREVVYLCSGYQ